MTSLLFNIGKLVGLFWFKQKFKYVFFFHSSNFGGAESVHLDILESLSLKPSEVSIVFTPFKDSDSGIKRFQKFGNTFNCSSGDKNRLLFFFYLGLFSSIINKSNSKFVFGSVSYFYYRLVPFIKKEIKKYDLIHALVNENQKGFEHMSEPVDFSFTRRFVTHNGIKEYLLKRRKSKNNVYHSPIVVIPNAVNFDINETSKIKSNNQLNCLYVGRNSAEKRVEIIFNAAVIAKAQELPFKFTFVGDKFEEFIDRAPENCNFAGLITNKNELSEIYKISDIILLTSEREGLPMSILEAMYFGCVPIVTNVGGLPDLVDKKCGYLIRSTSKDIDIQIVDILNHIQSSHEMIEKSINCSQKIKNEYSIELFKIAYRDNLLYKL